MIAAGTPRGAILGAEEAEGFLAAFGATMAELETLLEHETGEIAAGRIRSGLAREARKGELAAGYLKGFERARVNAVALARFAPRSAARLKDAHAGFRAALERNQQVLATAKAVSEGLVKGVADEMARQARPTTYGSPPPRRSVAGPIAFSGRM